MGRETIRVAFITNYITPYRITFYSKMADLAGVDLLVLHGAVKKEAGRPAANVTGDWKFNQRLITNNEKKIGPFTVRWQSGILPILRDFKPDVVVTLGISGTISNWILGIWTHLKKSRFLMWMCGWEAQKRGSFAYKLKCTFLKAFVRLPDTLMVYSSKAKRYMQELGVDGNKCVICYNGLDIQGSKKTEEEVKLNAVSLRKQINPKNLLIFLYVGGMLKEKKVDMLIHSFSDFSKGNDAELWLIGDGPEKNSLVALAEQTHARIRFLGRIIDDVDKYFAAADFFILPGIGGLALNQAMFWGTPCICSEADGTESDLVIDGITGLSFSTSDAQSLMQTLSRARGILDDCNVYNQMVREGRKLIEDRSNSDVILKTYYKEFIKGSR